MESVKRFWNTHPVLSNWTVLAVGMVVILYFQRAPCGFLAQPVGRAGWRDDCIGRLVRVDHQLGVGAAIVMSKRDYYDVLGVTRGVDHDALKRAFRQKAQQYHPDVNKSPEAEVQFKEINEAYQVLSDDQRRAADTTALDTTACAIWASTISTAVSATWAASSRSFWRLWHGRRRTLRRQPRAGADLRADITLTFEEAVFGTERELEVPRLETCDRCNGTGAEPPTSPVSCSNCGGSGEVRRRQQSALFGSVVTASTCPACGGSGEVIPSPCEKCNGGKRVRVSREDRRRRYPQAWTTARVFGWPARAKQASSEAQPATYM